MDSEGMEPNRMKPRRMEPVKKYRIYLAAINATMSNLALGTCVGWTSPILPKLMAPSPDNPLNVGITNAEAGWIGSILAIGGSASSLIAGLLVAKIGRKWTLLISTIFILASYILLLFASELWIIYVARSLQGIAGGLILTALPMYIGEIATDDCRGATGSLITLLMICGILYSYCIGPYVSYMTLQWCCMAIPIIFFATFIFMPESPYFYATKGRKCDGMKSLLFLRGQSLDALEIEMTQIQSTVDENMSKSGTFLDVLRIRGYRNAFFICCGLVMFQQLSGTTAVTFNSQSIFTSAKSTLDPAIATITLAAVQLVANLVTPFVIERTGRKVILLISAVIMCLALFALGTFFYIKAFKDASSILWLPVPALITFNLAYSFGFGPIPYAIMGEMYPSNIKSVAMSISSSFVWFVGFVVTRWFPELNALGAYYSFYLFGSCCILAIFFVLFIVIETKGMSLQKIQEKLHS